MSYVAENEQVELNQDGKPTVFEPKKEVEIKDIRFEVNLDNFELDDMEVLDASKPGVTSKEILDVLDRLIVGGVRGKGYKFSMIKTLGNAIVSAVNASVDSKN